jgi:hypothetical protein
VCFCSSSDDEHLGSLKLEGHFLKSYYRLLGKELIMCFKSKFLMKGLCIDRRLEDMGVY